MKSASQNRQAEISTLPIGIFDSGVGGLTVYRALHERLPDEHFVYLGDTARVPYGTKSLATVERYAVENARFLEAHDIKLLVVACNTASALALPAIRDAVNVEVVGVIEPGARAAVENSKVAAEASYDGSAEAEKMQTKSGRSQRRIGVIATESTVQSGVYTRAIRKLDQQATVIERACPLFVSLAEEGWAETEVARTVAAEYLSDLKGGGIDSLVLGCTHYPILRDVIQAAIGEEVSLIDSGEATARDVERWLADSFMTRAAPENRAPERRLCDDLDHFYVTDAADRFARVAERFLGHPPSVLEAVEVWGHDELRTERRHPACP